MRLLSWYTIPTILLLAFSIPKTKKSEINVPARDWQPQDSTAIIGKKVFYASCYTCHKDSLISLAPGQAILASMTPRAVLAAMDNGKMRLQAANLSEQERRAVAQWVTQSKLKESEIPQNVYIPFSMPAGQSRQFDHSGWGGDREGTGFRNALQSGITPANVSTLKLKWAFAFPDETVNRSKPAVVGDWLIAGGQYGDLFAIHRKSGKPAWHFLAASAIRGAVTISRSENAITAYFSDYSTNVYAVNVKTGKLIWTKRAGFESASTNTGSVAVYNGIVYVPISSLEVALAAGGNYPCCTSSGGLVALDAKTGKEIWHHRVVETAKEAGKKKNGKNFYGPSGAPVWCSPTIDTRRGIVYIGTGENYSLPYTGTSDAIQALDLKTGKLKWNFQATSNDAYNLACPYLNNCPEKMGPDLDFGMAPILVRKKDGRDLLVVGQKSGVVFAINPDNGKTIWQQRIGKGGALGGIHWGMATDGKNVYAANADNLIAIDIRDTGQKAAPGIFALNLENGQVIWKTPAPPCKDKKGCFPVNSAAPIVVPGIVFAGALDGHIRAYNSIDGKVMWDFDTMTNFETTNGIKGAGGSLDGPSPVVANGMLYVSSGYGMFGQKAGNVLLAFEVDKK